LRIVPEPGQSRAREVLLTLAIALLALVLFDTRILYPLRLFVVFLHELSHGLAAVLTGGSIERIELQAQEGGFCVTRGGSRFLTLSAGYLGSLAWGVALLLLGARTRLDRPVVGAMGLLTLLVTVVYVRGLFGFLFGLLAAAALLATARWLPAQASDLLLRVVGTVSCLYAVWDIASDALLRDIPGSDANALGQLTGIPGFLWAVLWIAVAVVVTGWALWYAASPHRHDPAAAQRLLPGL
jgi:hypothetical protein